jgi:hypothetical protein
MSCLVTFRDARANSRSIVGFHLNADVAINALCMADWAAWDTRSGTERRTRYWVQFGRISSTALVDGY